MRVVRHDAGRNLEVLMEKIDKEFPGSESGAVECD
jgi:hypothetical protein